MIKSFLGKTYNYLLHLSIDLRLKYYRFKNRKKPKLFFYTDSRGHEITQKKNKHNPFSSYISYFIKNYNCDVYVCEQKSTTIIDFLKKYNESSKDYDFVISHVGVVDFASRPLSQATEIIKNRSSYLKEVLKEKNYSRLLSFSGYDVLYEGKPTSSIAPDFVLDDLLKEVNKVANLIWISCNEVDLDWRGNYKRERPSNSDMIIEKSKYFVSGLKTNKIVNLTLLNKQEIHKYTCDNVHLSEEGMNLIENKIKELILVS